VIKKATGKSIFQYGGRKGFQDLMLNRGQKLEDISAWMGHQSIEMTWKRYRNRKRVKVTKAG
jgi:integrase